MPVVPDTDCTVDQLVVDDALAELPVIVMPIARELNTPAAAATFSLFNTRFPPEFEYQCGNPLRTVGKQGYLEATSRQANRDNLSYAAKIFRGSE
jgi:hypothetical protein